MVTKSIDVLSPSVPSSFYIRLRDGEWRWDGLSRLAITLRDSGCSSFVIYGNSEDVEITLTNGDIEQQEFVSLEILPLQTMSASEIRDRIESLMLEWNYVQKGQ